MAELEGKVALVTGGASGIGRATAERMRDEGARVVIADVDEKAGRGEADELGVDFAVLDVSDPGAWSAVTSGIAERHGGLDVAYLNAGVTTYPADVSGLHDVDIATLRDDAYRRIMGVNLDGVVYGVRAVVPRLSARGGGAIVATASVAGLVGFAQDAIYTATKHAVVGLVRGLAPQLEPKGITINAICPGGVNTAILGPSAGALRSTAGAQLMQPGQIADAVVQAATSGKTGQAWVCLLGREHQIHQFTRVEGLGSG